MIQPLPVSRSASVTPSPRSVLGSLRRMACASPWGVGFADSPSNRRPGPADIRCAGSRMQRSERRRACSSSVPPAASGPDWPLWPPGLREPAGDAAPRESAPPAPYGKAGTGCPGACPSPQRSATSWGGRTSPLTAPETAWQCHKRSGDPPAVLRLFDTSVRLRTPLSQRLCRDRMTAGWSQGLPRSEGAS